MELVSTVPVPGRALPIGVGRVDQGLLFSGVKVFV